MLDILFLLFWIGYSVAIFTVKHRMFTVYYREGGFLRELVLIAFFGMVLAKITVDILQQFLPIIIVVLILLVAGIIIFNRKKEKEVETEEEKTETEDV